MSETGPTGPFKTFPARDPQAGIPLLRLDLHQQATLGEAIGQCRRLADLLQVAVGTHFRELPLVAFPGELTELVLERYNTMRRQIEEAARTQALRDSLTPGGRQ